MSPARSAYQQRHVRDLFGELVDLDPPTREKRLAEVARLDEELADAVVGLLRADAHATESLHDLDRLFGREGEPDPGPDPMVGLDISHYRVLERLGGGGMGVVYRARDTLLDRIVALKVLHPGSAPGEEARARLLREARAASALDHPNIATVHDVLEIPDGRGCIVMAFYEGRTLRNLLREGPLDFRRVLWIGVQIARGLEAAHDRGIVHCDVKPGNVLLRDTGVAKILDFGLARSVDRPGREPSRGTLPYMAPEQLRREPISPRTDVWALGVILYEMATGRRPFDGADARATARAILSREPPAPPSSMAPDLPAWFDDLVDRTLRRGPAERPEDGGDVREALEEGEATLQKTRRGSWVRSVGMTVVVAGVVGIAIVASVRDGGSPEIRFERPRQLSSADGVEDFGSWSSEARAVVYQSRPRGEIFGGNADVLLREPGEDAARNLTDDYEGYDGRPAWSPDGRRVAFYSDREGGGIYVVSLEGDPPRKVRGGQRPCCASNAPVWSPEGSELAITVDAGRTGATLEVISAEDGSVKRRLPLPGRPGSSRFGTVWSPDGRFVAVADAMNRTPDEAKLWIVRMEDGVSFAVTDGRDLAWSPTWGPEARTLYYVSDRGGSRDLWAQAIAPDGRPAGEPRAVTTGIGMRNAALSRDGNRLVYSKGRMVANVWRVPILEGRAAGWGDAEPVTSDRAYVEFVDAAPGGRFLLVSSDRAGSQDLWMFDPAGESKRRLTTDPAPAWAPMLSPDGSRVAYYSARSGNRDIWIHSLEDGTDTRLTRDEGIDFVPSWSPDGRRLAFASGRTGNLDIWTVDVDGGRLRRLTSDPAMDGWPHWSPDGSTIVFRSNRDGRSRLYRIPSGGGIPTPVTRISTTYFRWARDGSALYLVSGGQLWIHDLATGEERTLTALEQRQGGPGVVALAVGENHLYFTWEEDIADLWMMDRMR